MAPRSSRSLLASLALLLALASLARGCSDDSTEAAAGAAGASAAAGAAGALAGRGGSAGKAGKAGSAGKPSGGSAGSSAGTGDSGSAGADAGAAGSDAGSAGSAGSYPGPTGCGPYSPPPTVPAGWVEYTDWSCLCRLYRPPTPDLMPAPIAWQACPSQVDSSLSCQRMATPWSQGKPPLDFFPRVWPVPGSSQVLLQFSRGNVEGNPDVRYHLIAEADGPVRQAFLQVNPVSGGCYMNAQGLSEGRYLWSMKGDTWDEPGFGTVEGFLAGDLDSPPSAVVKQPQDPGLASNWDVSKDWIVQKRGPRYVRPWDKPTEPTLIHAAAQDPDGAFASLVVPIGPRVLLGVGEGPYHGISLWSPDQGLQPWQRWSGDLTRGAGNVGTDGKDVVWTYGEGKKPQDEEFPATSVFTAPFATDMATIETTKRRLRADVSRPGDARYQYTVGCGYAARRYFATPETSDLLVVRLSDGRGWKIPGHLAGPGGVFWDQVLAISCEHLYATLGTVESSSFITRIPLASLGPGLAPD